jgi:mannan endo-1,4-beta-mannosidase
MTGRRRAASIRAASILAGTALAAVLVLAGCGPLGSGGSGSSGGGSSSSGGSGTAGTGAASPPASLPYNMSSLLAPTSGKFLGVEADGVPDSLAPVSSFAASIGTKPNLIGKYVAWHTSFDAHAAAKAWSYGALYYMAWEPYGTTLASIAAGHSDAYITKFARAVRALNLPVAISFGHEMNGNWYPWASNLASAADFVAAWRHIHNLFIAAGASNVIWVWNPNVITALPQVQLQPYYPGDAYVDWVGITGYFATTGPHSFKGLYGPTMSEIRRFTAKPFIIAETAVETGPAQTAAVRSLISGIEHRSKVLGLVWFDYDKAGVDWRVESRPIVQAAMSKDITRLRLMNPK